MAEGYKDFTSGDVLTAAQVDDYLMLQAVMRFADASARDTALSAVLTEGLVAYLKDVDTVTMYTGSVWITAYHIGAMTSWTPTLWQGEAGGPGGAPNVVTATVEYAKYQRMGRLITGSYRLTATAGGITTGDDNVYVSTPVAAATSFNSVGAGHIYDDSVPRYFAGTLSLASTGKFAYVGHDSATAMDYALVPLASGDVVTGSFSFEAA